MTDAPYYIVPLIEEYKTLDPSSQRAKELSRKISANIGDYASLRLVLGIDPPEFARFYPDLDIVTPTTIDTIDSFLEKYGKDLPAAGYIPEAPEDSATEALPPEKEETTWQSLVKEHRYREALELINAQNLKNPQKSIYFAHQMRFIKKLISIENFKNQ